MRAGIELMDHRVLHVVTHHSAVHPAFHALKAGWQGTSGRHAS